MAEICWLHNCRDKLNITTCLIAPNITRQSYVIADFVPGNPFADVAAGTGSYRLRVQRHLGAHVDVTVFRRVLDTVKLARSGSTKRRLNITGCAALVYVWLRTERSGVDAAEVGA